MGKTAYLSAELGNLQANTIGWFKPTHSDKTWLVIEDENDVLTCVTIGELAGLQTLHIGKDQGRLMLFGGKQTMWDIMKDPFELDRMYKLFNGK